MHSKKEEHLQIPKVKKYCRKCQTNTEYKPIQNKNRLYGYECKICQEFTSIGLTLGIQFPDIFNKLKQNKVK